MVEVVLCDGGLLVIVLYRSWFNDAERPVMLFSRRWGYRGYLVRGGGISGC